MIYKTFFHQIPTGENVKFTISDKQINGHTVYYTNFINTDLDVYQKMSEEQKAVNIGIQIKDDDNNIVFYKNPEHFEEDIKNIFGVDRLKSNL